MKKIKNKMQRLALTATFLICIFVATGKMSAQVTCGITTFYVENNTKCKAKVNIYFYDNGGSLCGTQSGVLIGPNSSINALWPSTCGIAPCDITVELVNDGSFTWFSGAAVCGGGSIPGSGTSIPIATDSFSAPNTCLKTGLPPHLTTMDWMGGVGVMISN